MSSLIPHPSSLCQGSGGFFGGLFRRRSRARARGLLESLAGALDQRGEAGCVAHGQISEDLAVDRISRRLQACHELGVRDAVQASGGVDARDPQLAEVTFAI